MINLVSGATSTVRRLLPHSNLGILITPRATQNLEVAFAGIEQSVIFGYDNDCFQGLDPDAFCVMVETAYHSNKYRKRFRDCKFVTIPDVVGDHEATLEEWEMWYPYVYEVGLPPAFVLQDGATSDMIPWGVCKAVFLGGSDAYKLSPEARLLCLEARRRGKWVHVGRVNSARRERLIAAFADSFDGTAYSRFPDTHLPRCLARLGQQAMYI